MKELNLNQNGIKSIDNVTFSGLDKLKNYFFNIITYHHWKMLLFVGLENLIELNLWRKSNNSSLNKVNFKWNNKLEKLTFKQKWNKINR